MIRSGPRVQIQHVAARAAATGDASGFGCAAQSRNGCCQARLERRASRGAALDGLSHDAYAAAVLHAERRRQDPERRSSSRLSGRVRRRGQSAQRCHAVRRVGRPRGCGHVRTAATERAGGTRRGGVAGQPKRVVVQSSGQAAASIQRRLPAHRLPARSARRCNRTTHQRHRRTTPHSPLRGRSKSGGQKRPSLPVSRI